MDGRIWKSLSVFALAIAAMTQGCNCGTATVTYYDDGGPACASDSDCGPNEVCTDGACVATVDGSTGCASDGDCPAGQICGNGGTCVPPIVYDAGNGSDGGTDAAGGGAGGGSDGGGGDADAGSGDPGDGGSGGGSTTGLDGGSDECSSDADCPPGTQCEDGACVCDGDADDGSDHSCRDGKALLCHYPPGNPVNRHDICVGVAAVDAHLGHGDTEGTCP